MAILNQHQNSSDRAQPESSITGTMDSNSAVEEEPERTDLKVAVDPQNKPETVDLKVNVDPQDVPKKVDLKAVVDPQDVSEKADMKVASNRPDVHKIADLEIAVDPQNTPSTTRAEQVAKTVRVMLECGTETTRPSIRNLFHVPVPVRSWHGCVAGRDDWSQEEA